jgi:hypothetical protein
MKSPVEFLRDIPRSHRLAATLAAGVLALEAVVLIASGDNTDTNNIDPTQPDAVLASGETVGRGGPVLVGPEVSRGVNCERGTHIYRVGSPIYTRGDRLTFAPNRETYNHGVDNHGVGDNTQTGYVGLNEGYAGTYSYYPLIKGWALRQDSVDQEYDLYNFSIENYKQQGKGFIGPEVTGEIVGQRVESFSLIELAMRDSITWSDTDTSVTVSLARDLFSNSQPAFNLDIECLDYIPPRPLDP